MQIPLDKSKKMVIIIDVRIKNLRIHAFFNCLGGNLYEKGND